MVGGEIKAAFDPADEGLVRVLLQAEHLQGLIDNPEGTAQLPAGRTSSQASCARSVIRTRSHNHPRLLRCEKAFRLYEQGTVHASGLTASRCMQGVGRHGSMMEPALLALGPHLLSDVFAADVRLNLECSIPLGKLLGILEVQPHPSFAPVAHKPQQTQTRGEKNEGAREWGGAR